MLNLRKFFLQCFVLAALTIGTLFACLPHASADQLPDDEPVISTPATSDPCFRQDPECYGPTPELVECDNNEFTYKNANGTWTCPDQLVIPPGTMPGPDQVSPGGSHPFQEQLPNEVIGRQVDCPDGSVGRIIDVSLKTTCDPEETGLAAMPPDEEVISFDQSLLYGAIAVGLVLLTGFTLYMIFRKNPS